jgi:glycosyltransferase involved in cell wall biosynthesis
MRTVEPSERWQTRSGEVARSPRERSRASIGLIALVPDTWGPAWQPRHQVLSRLAGYFEVVWVNPALGWREVLAGRTGAAAERDAAPSPSGFQVYDPHPWLPKFYRPKWLAESSFRARLWRARRLLRKRGCRKIILYIWRPEFAEAIEFGGYDLSCYHIDDEYSFSSTEVPVSAEERSLIERVDQVFVHSATLLEKKGRINANTKVVPNGVDFGSFSHPVAPPADIAAIRHPRIGYAGYIKKQLDLPLLVSLAKARPEWQIVMIGGTSPHDEIREAIAALRALPNVHLLGAKSTRELAPYAQHFDVCIMPYVVDDYTRYIYPLKLHEYLAGGRPVVGTRLPSLEPFGDVISLADTEADWLASIEELLQPPANDVRHRAARRAVAKQHDWEVLVEGIAAAMLRLIDSQPQVAR